MNAPISRPLEAIRAATRALHERLDGSEFARAVLAGTLPLPRYGSFLRAVDGVLAELEHRLEQAPGLRAAAPHGPPRRERLARDLAYLQVDPRGVDMATLQAMLLTQRMRRDAGLGEAGLLGYLYVLEGSQLGGLVQKRALEQRPEFRGGLAYLAGAGRDTAAEFKAFAARLDQLPADQIAAAITGATHCFEGFQQIVNAVMSDELDGRWLAGSLNLDAGMHPLPRDVREIHAALRAGEQSYRSWSYYEARYGEKGLRFTRSDSAWLVTLCSEDAALALKNVRWLGGLLSARGMPQLLLERHLEQLHTELGACVPERLSAYESLRSAAHTLHRERTAVLADSELGALAQSFDAPSEHIDTRQAGLLLIAALIDEKRGLAQALPSLTAWLGDPARFSQRWCAAVEHTVELGRAAF